MGVKSSKTVPEMVMVVVPEPPSEAEKLARMEQAMRENLAKRQEDAGLPVTAYEQHHGCIMELFQTFRVTFVSSRHQVMVRLLEPS